MTIRLLFGLLGLFACYSLAHADSPEPPLLVSEDGTDIGDCQDVASPCQSISYALQRVGKHGRIDVAGGTFALADPADAIYMLSGAIDIRGSSKERTHLVGVPPQFAAELEKLGFHIIIDSKGLDRQTRAQHEKLAVNQQRVMASAAAVNCVGGFADVYPCSNVDLLGQVSDRASSVRGADIWGFIDLNTHREYAIMGYQTGTSVYDVTDPENPAEVGFVDGQSTTWRDIKVHQAWNAADGRWNAYAYISADSTSDGLFIIDLTDLPHRVSRLSYPSDFSAAHNVYLTDTDFSTGLSITGDAPVLILAGSNINDGRFRGYSLADPTSPSFVSAPATPGDQPGGDRLYMHDGASMVVTDDRRNTQCVNAAASDHCDIVLDFNEGSLDIWDYTNPGNPQRLSTTPYSNATYTHSGWWSEDQQFVFLQDELDERDRGLQTTLRVFDVSDLTAPTLAGTWTGPTRAIDHNGFVRGNRYYMSNYSRGLTILDITNAASPVTVGRFDSYPSGDGVGFPGAWGAYPYLPSGNVAISDIDSGLYIVRDNTLSVAEGTLSFTTDAFGADESQSLVLDVQRTGGSQGAVSAEWEVLSATADGTDILVSDGTLNWANTDAAAKSVTIGLNDDGAAEGLERIIVRLKAPTGGATLSSPSMASGWIS
ncbi:MAG: choice-of-anchor B family protein, partial [Pseudomonadota bacterium]